ncbi:YebC/PmpR family DNA-binding transcriptional regulator [Patescibacteria group bacterium]
MSGHSKWHNIKRKKEATDAKKSKIFSKISRLITIAAKQGGGDPDANPNLRLAIQKAKETNMPKDNISKAIKKGTGELGDQSFEEVTYEGYGPGGGALMIYCLTDNKNRTVSELRNILDKNGGNLSTQGSTSYIFDPKTYEPTFFTLVSSSEETRVERLLDTLEDHDDVQEVYHNYDNSGN